jgi:hypothetical protein
LKESLSLKAFGLKIPGQVTTAKKVFEDAVVEQTRNQRFQAPKEVGSITSPYKRESLED